MERSSQAIAILNLGDEVLMTRMNPDLAMDTADQKLLKSTSAGNLFMVFGEPDLELRTDEVLKGV